MEVDFVTFEIAKKLKEKGFPQNMCNDEYGYITSKYDEYDIGERVGIWYIPSYLPCIAAPTIAQALKWLREKGIHAQIEISTLGWYGTLYTFSKDEKGLYDIYDSYICIGDIYDNYEDAALSAIEYVLDNLI